MLAAICRHMSAKVSTCVDCCSLAGSLYSPHGFGCVFHWARRCDHCADQGGRVTNGPSWCLGQRRAAMWAHSARRLSIILLLALLLGGLPTASLRAQGD